ncbi:MAG: protein phosphatase 2C domain-containing protein [Planctomycetota bacterium]
MAAANTSGVGGVRKGRWKTLWHRFLGRSRELLKAARASYCLNPVGVRPVVCAAASPMMLNFDSHTSRRIVNNLESLDETPPNELHISVKQSFAQAKDDLISHAKTLGVSVEELGCTALAVLLDTRTGKGVLGQVGDGAVLQLSRDGAFNEVVDMPETDDPQATFVIGTSTLESALRINRFCMTPGEKNAAIFVMTDGLSHDLLYTGRKDQAATWAKSVNRLLSDAGDLSETANGMLRWLDEYRMSGSRDDRTLVVITCGNGGENQR